MSNKNKRSLRKDWHMIKRAVGILNEIMPHFWLWQAVCALFEAFTPYFGVYMSALIVNELAGDCNIEKLLSYAAISAIGIFVISIITRLLQRQRTIKDYMLWQQHEAYIIRAQNHLQYEHLENPDVVLRRSKIFSAFNATGGGLPVVKWSVQVIISSVLNIIFSVSLTISMFSMAAEGEFTGIWAIVNSPLSSAIIILLIAVNTVLSVKLSA